MHQQMALGKATIRPDRPVVAGSFTTITFTYTAEHPVDDSGYIKIVFRSQGDFGAPQFEDPTAPNYASISTTGDCRIEPRWAPKGHTRPWGRALFLKVRGGFLNTGESITVLFGDTSAGAPGWQMQTFCEETFEFKTLVDPIATYRFKELPVSPVLRIVSGPPAEAVCIAPSQVRIREPFRYHLKLEDAWGNPTGHPQALQHPGFPAPGIHRIHAEDLQTGLSAQSNPVRVVSQDARLRPYWADFHGQSEETIGTNSIESYFAFARDFGLLDIAAHQGNDFQVTDEFWAKVNEVTNAFYQPGAFVTFPGYEWSGNTPLGGDRNIYFVSEGGSIARSCRDLLPGAASAHADAPTARELFRRLRESDGPPAFVFAHVGGRYADMSQHDPEIELAVEVHSAWGTFEWLVEDALKRDYQVGICANSDGHKGRPGASYPGAGKFGSLGGLTCVLARGLDRESIHQALVSRHFYATTGNRALVDVQLVASDGQSSQIAMMGDTIEVGLAGQDGVGSDPLVLRVWAAGTAPIEKVEIRNRLQVIETLRPYTGADLGNRIKIVWRGAEVRGRDRMVAWDGSLRVLGNAILRVDPINFWNAHHRPEMTGSDGLTWRSATTGGLSGIILTLRDARSGALEIETLQGRARCKIQEVGLDPRIWTLGGLGKQIEVLRLPPLGSPREFSFDLPLTSLSAGENALYVRMTQEDGHMAWTSPIYLRQPA